MSAPMRWSYRLHIFQAGDLIEDFAIVAHDADDARQKGIELLDRIRASVHPRWLLFDTWEIVRLDQTETPLLGGGR